MGIERPASVPPILEDEDDMMTVLAEVEAGARANRKRKRDQLAWDYRDETGGGGGGGSGEDVSEDEAILSADERKRARIGHGGTGARRRSLGDDERRPGSMVRAIFFWHNDARSFSFCGGGRCEHVLRIELVLNKISIPLAFIGLRN